MKFFRLAKFDNKGFTLKTLSDASEKSRKGFTLIETIIYFTLLSIILLIVVDLFFRISENSLESSTKNALEVEGNYILKRIEYDIHRIDTENGDFVIQPDDPGESLPVLTLLISEVPYVYMPWPDFGSELIFGVYADIDSVTRVTSNSVHTSEISFTRIVNNNDKPTIKVNFTLESTIPSKNGTFESKDFESVFSVR